MGVKTGDFDTLTHIPIEHQSFMMTQKFTPVNNDIHILYSV